MKDRRTPLCCGWHRRVRPALALLTCLAALVTVSSALAGPARPGNIGEDSSPLSRESALVVVPGSQLAEFASRPVSELALFAADLGLQQFVPVPFQIDERFDRVFNEGTPAEFSALVHDVFGEDDGLFDEQDELAFLFGEGGVRAPNELPWPAGAEGLRIEIEVVDPREGGETRWLYLFAGQGLERSTRTYVTWNTLPSGDVDTDAFVVEYEDTWILDGFRVKAPCGAGADLIDRLKGRAVPLLGRNEDEEGWNDNSLYLGGLVGPVRAIRYVQGAMSGVNTIHHDVISRGSMRRTIDLRVHELVSASVYFDMRPNPGGVFYSSTETDGFVVDGLPDSPGGGFPEWTLYSSDAGGLVSIVELPAVPRYEEAIPLYFDDASYDDTIPENPGYSDEDDSAYGAHGFRLLETDDSNFDPISLFLRVSPPCAVQGDASVGSAHLELQEEPVDPSATPQWQQLGAIRTLHVTEEGEDTRLAWEPLAGDVQGYRVYRARSADLPQGSWTLIYEGSSTTFVDDETLGTDSVFFYTVVAFNEQGEGRW